MRELYRGEHFVVILDDERALLRRSRTDRRFESNEEILRSYEVLIRVHETIDRARLALFVDLRLAPPRNDPAFEQLVGPYQPRLYGGFRRAAILVKTEAGKLQMARLLQANGIRARAFLDEAAAISHLLDPAT
jgi:hypothetical protein